MQTFFDFSVPAIDGSGDAIAGVGGCAVLAVNVASECGYTPQYADLEALHEALAERGFAVLGFPCNQFGAQEPGTEEEIRTFCRTAWGIEFPLTRKIDVNGAGRHPVFAWLTAGEQGFPGDVKWNFEKFLIGSDGRLRGRYRSAVEPADPALRADIEAALSVPG